MLLVVAGVFEQGFKGLLAQWTNARLVAFAGYCDFALIPVDVLPVGSAKLRYPQDGSVKHLEESSIAHGQEDFFAWNA